MKKIIKICVCVLFLCASLFLSFIVGEGKASKSAYDAQINELASFFAIYEGALKNNKKEKNEEYLLLIESHLHYMFYEFVRLEKNLKFDGKFVFQCVLVNRYRAVFRERKAELDLDAYAPVLKYLRHNCI